MLIIEGPDRVGKTTLALKLVEELNGTGEGFWFYSHMGRPNKTFHFLHDYVSHMNTFLVQDRFHLGEWAYGDDEGRCRARAVHRRLIQAELDRIGAYTVVVIPGVDLYTGEDLDTAFSNEELRIAHQRFAHPPFEYRIDLRLDMLHPAKHKAVIKLVVGNYLERLRENYNAIRTVQKED